MDPVPASRASLAYGALRRRRLWGLCALAALALLLAALAIGAGTYGLSWSEVAGAILGRGEAASRIVVLRIRLPRILAALVAGWGLSASGLAMQTLLRNPLGSPSTLGISHGAAFGAALAIVLFGAGPAPGAAPGLTAQVVTALGFYPEALFALAGALGATGVILLLARLRRMPPEALILAGVALSSLFTSGAVLVQLFATEEELASVVFWSFGDVARSSWGEIGLMAAGTAAATAYLAFNRWNLNALVAGGEVARGLGVEVEKLRRRGMFAAALVASLVTAFHGVIGFLGLVAPHMARRLVGADHRLLLPLSCVLGAFILLAADTAGRLLLGSGALPVGVLTSFLGAPLFLYLLLKGRRA